MTKNEHIIIPGAQKSGTTTIYDLLMRSGRVYDPNRGAHKEPHFFAHEETTVGENIDWYRRILGVNREHISLDASTAYLSAPGVPERIRRYFPNAKILIILRDPAQRAYSAYNHERKGTPPTETRAFDEILERLAPAGDLPTLARQEEELIEQDLERDALQHPSPTCRWHRDHVQAPFEADFEDPIWQYRYFRNSCYQYGVERFEEAFQHVKVVFLENLVTQPEAVIPDLLRFCGIDSSAVEPRLPQSNATKVPTGMGRMYARLRDRHSRLADALDWGRDAFKKTADLLDGDALVQKLRSLFWSSPKLTESQYGSARRLLEPEYTYWAERRPSTTDLWTY